MRKKNLNNFGYSMYQTEYVDNLKMRVVELETEMARMVSSHYDIPVGSFGYFDGKAWLPMTVEDFIMEKEKE